jgi:hypothetical protein
VLYLASIYLHQFIKKSLAIEWQLQLNEACGCSNAAALLRIRSACKRYIHKAFYNSPDKHNEGMNWKGS